MRAERFYLLEACDGDEILLADCASFDDALAAFNAIKAGHESPFDLSIASTTRGIVYSLETGVIGIYESSKV